MKHVQKKRRQFLRGVAVLGGGAAIATIADDATADEKSAGPPAAPTSKAYRVTRHIRDYYNKARF